MDKEKNWNNQQIVDLFMDEIVRQANDIPDDIVTHIIEKVNQKDVEGLKLSIASLNEDLLHSFFYLLQAAGPIGWPEIKMVNGQTLEELSEDLQWDLASAINKFHPD